MIFRPANRIASPAYYFFLVIALAAFNSDSSFARPVRHRPAKISKASRLATRAVPESDTVGEVFVPRLGLKAVVAEGDSEEVLKRSAGHVPETALPGQWGNVALAAHRNTFFRPLRNIRLGDMIVVKTADGSFVYQVDRTTVVYPSDIQVLQATGTNTLTLITCFPFNYRGVAPQRFIVRAHEVRPSAEQDSLLAASSVARR